MTDQLYPKSQLPIRKTEDLLPGIFKTEANKKFMSAVVDPLVQPGLLEKTVGYVGRRYGKTYQGTDIYLDSDESLRSRYQLEPGVVYQNKETVENFYDYIDFKNQLKFFGNNVERDDLTTAQQHYSWNPPVTWDKFINYREYYWEPNGPLSVPVNGTDATVVSEYDVTIDGHTFVFNSASPNTRNNPTLHLFRGQTYKFAITAPHEGFVIRNKYDTGSLVYNSLYSYVNGQLAVYDHKLLKAKHTIPSKQSVSIPDEVIDWDVVQYIYQSEISYFNQATEYPVGEYAVYNDFLWQALNPIPANTTITLSPTDWRNLGVVVNSPTLDYNKGITNNGTGSGTITFVVPYDSPDELFYQSPVDPDKFGRFIIDDISENTAIDVERDVIGLAAYTSSNNVIFTNGMVVEFRGDVTPAQYATDIWLVNGVGVAITLVRFSDLTITSVSKNVPDVMFDNGGFDTEPYDNAAFYPGDQDYITIASASVDSNPWSRGNRWFHRSVLEYSCRLNGVEYTAPEEMRAKRPIIEFSANLQLFNHGTHAKRAVDVVDNVNIDVFSVIEGSSSYVIDGIQLSAGVRLLIIADRDGLANNKIYEVTFAPVVGLGENRIHLVETTDTDPMIGECVSITSGTLDGGAMYHYDGSVWVRSQPKTAVNQTPVFDIFDESDVSFSDTNTYPASTFAGSKILSYKVGNGRVDQHLGFSLSYLNIDNVGDIQFDWNYGTDTFIYTENKEKITINAATGYYRVNFVGGEYANGWIKTDNTYIQPVIDSVVVQDSTNEINFTPIDFYGSTQDAWVIKFYLNGAPLTASYTQDQNLFTFNTVFNPGDVVAIKVISNNEPDTGYYEMPVGLEKNPLNAELVSFTLGQADDHIKSAIDFHPQFIGNIPGVSNLRDLDNYQQFATRFVKHSGIAPLAISVLCDKEHNIIKSLRYVKKMYGAFKNNFLDKAAMLPLTPVAGAVDDIIASLTKTKSASSPFAYSDMIGSGAYTKLEYVVDRAGNTTFPLTNKFNLVDLSNNAVYVYLNRLTSNGSLSTTHLIHTTDYQFNDVYGYVAVSHPLLIGDIIEIRAYLSTAINYIPATPSSMGLYKAYTPMIFDDDTYTTPRRVIQGHDGSITAAYGDYRDALLLELELRIYNNIKHQYDQSIFDIDAVLGGYYNTGSYTKLQLDDVVRQEGYNWLSVSNIDHVHNTWYEELNAFTYTYSQALDPTRTQRLPGYWRGIYNWFYDTDRPHRCPWEMLGFSEQPTWWESEYGVAPYTNQNFILWDDLRDGIIRHGVRAGVHTRYQRPDLLSHIPVDQNGRLLDPIATGLVNDFDSFTDKDNFVIGDVSPVEYSWRSSSDWPFVISIAMCLLKPFEYITDRFDISRTKLNRLGQTVHTGTSLAVTLGDLVLPTTTDMAIGLGTYLIDSIKSTGTDTNVLVNKIKNLDVRLSTRLSGFVVLDQQKYILDSKHQANSGSVFVPPENVDIIFNVSSPVKTINYSGVIVEKTNGGWFLSGYDNNNQYFNYYRANQSSKDPQITLTPVDTSELMAVGGVSQPYSVWTPNVVYKNGEIVKYQTQFFRAVRTNSHATFDNTFHDWHLMKNLPTIGEVVAVKRSTFNKFSVKILNYGTKLESIQEVVDFLLGYEEYLKSIGFVFDGYDIETQTPVNWTTSCKELMFWTKHNWAEGSLIALSPIAKKIEILMGGGVAESVVDGFYDYDILKANGQPLSLNEIDISRTYQKITVSPTNSVDGIYYLNLYSVLKEHVAIFSDRTVFNDVIYDKPTGYRQGRIKSQGYRTVDWDGDYTSPGFLFDNVTITAWAAYTDYRMGDIVAYRSNNWTSAANQLGVAEFDNIKWTKLDSTPTKQLISNFDYKVNQFEDYYDVTSEGIGDNQRGLARHAIGYQTRSYLQDLAPDPVTQFQLYQGFIREKGTANAVTKVFDKLSRSGDASVVINEEWAFRVGSFGGVDQLRELELQVEKAMFKLNPQAIVVSSIINKPLNDQQYQVTRDNFTIAPVPFAVAINPVAYNEPIRTAGYVNTAHVDVVVKHRRDITSLDITTFTDNDHIWITFADYTWDVLRYNLTNLRVVSLATVETSVTLVLSERHRFVIGDIIGVKPVNAVTSLVGFFVVTSVEWNSIVIDGSLMTEAPVLPLLTPVYISGLTAARYANYNMIPDDIAATLAMGAKLWVDDDATGRWEVVTKQTTYVDSGLKELNYGNNSLPLTAGYSAIYVESLDQTIIGVPGSDYVVSYEGTTLSKKKKQLRSPLSMGDTLNSSFGMALAVSPDGRFLAVGAPLVSSVRSNFVGDYISTTDYLYGSIVIDTETDLMWEAAVNITDDGSTNSLVSDDWRPALVIPADIAGIRDGFVHQGAIAIYENTDSGWSLRRTCVSPIPTAGEMFGSDITIGVSADGSYTMAVTANGGAGQVYLYEYTGTNWNHYRHATVTGQYNPVLATTGKSVSISRDCTTLAIGKPDETSSGSVSVYTRDNAKQFNLVQTIDTAAGLHADDLLGYRVVLDSDGSTLCIACPRGDVTLGDQGSVYVMVKSGSQYVPHQRLHSYDAVSNEQFGISMSMSHTGKTLVIGAKNTLYTLRSGFDEDTTQFDENTTLFDEVIGSTGGVYLFEKKADKYVLTAKPKPTIQLMTLHESFGFSVYCTDDKVVVGSPTYVDKTNNKIGMVRLFTQSNSENSWNTISAQSAVVDLTKIKSIELYDEVTNTKIQDLDYVDHAKLKILNYVEQAITYKTLYDPAVYTNGTDQLTQIIEPSQSWADSYVGNLWWDLSTVKWVYAEQGDFVYRSGHWNQLAPGSSVDVYEWVKTKLMPSEWAILADTNEGIASGISGAPRFPDDDVLSVKVLYNPITGVSTESYYYYWVRNKVTIPSGSSRTISAATAAAAITNPIGTGVPFVAFASDSTILTYNVGDVIQSDTALVNIVYYKDDKALNPVHNEYQLLTEGLANSVPTGQLELKWLDSLIGADSAGNRVPDHSLPEKQRYGLSFRPRQSMFIDRPLVLESAITHINGVLMQAPFTSTIDFTVLNSIDEAPVFVANQYDIIVDTFNDLEFVNTERAQQASLRVGVTNGKLTEVTIVNPGYGYKPTTVVYENLNLPQFNYTGTGYAGPLVTISGDGTGAVVELIIDIYGRVIQTEIKYSGRKYNTAIATVRPLSVLVNSDITVDNFWSIYAWDSLNNQFIRVKTQLFDTTRYWAYADWWKSGYGIASRIVKEINSIVYFNEIEPEIGDLIRIKEYENGGWAVFERIADTDDFGTMNYDLEVFSDYYTIVGRENGTIQLRDLLYKTTFGYDGVAPYDGMPYDRDFTRELRHILLAVKHDVFKGIFQIEWNNLFFSSVRSAFAEQMYIDWAFKTSFITAVHNIGPFKQTLNYNNDNLSSFESYINEVKPYRTTVREYISRYDTVDTAAIGATDFDLPAAYNYVDGKITPVSGSNATATSNYPWKWWADNHAYSVVDIVIHNQGADYTWPPVINITGNGTGAKATAFITNGKVNRIELVSAGFGYTLAPTVTFEGGNPTGSVTATAVAFIGNSKARQFNLAMKFDRITKTGSQSDYTFTDTFITTGDQSSFRLTYPANTAKYKISVVKDGRIVLGDSYNVDLQLVNLGNADELTSHLIFETIPPINETITIVYEKHNSALDAVDRIGKYYDPTPGMRGKELSHLITGMDFGGVHVQGATFEVTGGWDGMPWGTDTWDNVESDKAFYHHCAKDGTDAPLPHITLPYAPATGQRVNVYIKPAPAHAVRFDIPNSYTKTPSTIRLDDINWSSNWTPTSSSNLYAVMSTFVGDGVNQSVAIGSYFDVYAGDVIILRLEESDGSVAVGDISSIDSVIQGGSLITGAYGTANGLTAAEIAIDGGVFISKAHVPATEENIPGQLLESISIRVYDEASSSASPLRTRYLVSDGVTTTFSIGLVIIEKTAVTVTVNKVKQVLGTDYTVDIANNTISFTTAPVAQQPVVIVAVGVGGPEILSYNEFITNGKTDKFTTTAMFKKTTSIYVTVNGIVETASFGKTNTKTYVQLTNKPATGSIVNVVCFAGTNNMFSSSLVQMKDQTVTYTGNPLIANIMGATTGEVSPIPVLVELNNTLLVGVDSNYAVYDGTTSTYAISKKTKPYVTGNIKVYVNDALIRYVVDYNFNTDLSEITISKQLIVGDSVLITNDVEAQFTINGNEITFNHNNVSVANQDIVQLSWFTNYQSMQMIISESAGGSQKYALPVRPVSADYVWVYKNSNRMLVNDDYLMTANASIEFVLNTVATDIIKIVLFGANLRRDASAFEITKDMFNVSGFTRFVVNEVKLSTALNYYDTVINVTETANLFKPTRKHNIPGVVYINGERIEYFVIDGNTLTQLRRGVFGTSIAETHLVDSSVVDVSVTERLPYQDLEYRYDIPKSAVTSTGFPVDFTPVKSVRTNWETGSIPAPYGPCDHIEVFVAGRRLSKNPTMIYNTSVGSTSPAGDVFVDAEFSVDGVNKFIRLTHPAPAGARILVFRKTGHVWYDQGSTTASKGVSLLENSTSVATFISQKTSLVPD